MIPFIIIALLSLLIIAFVVIIALRRLYENGHIFCNLPKNHTACVVLNGKFLHYLMHKEDRDATETHLRKLILPKVFKAEELAGKTDKEKADLAKGAEEVAEKEIQRRLKQIVVRGEDDIFVKLFNLNLIHWNPFATIKPVEIVRTHLVTGPKDEKRISDYITHGKPEHEDFLRLVWPRIMVITSLELIGQVQVDVLVQCTKIRVWDFDKIYFEFNGEISAEADNAIASAFVNYLGSLTLDIFQKEDMTARPATDPDSLTAKIKGGGLEAIGASLVGPVAIAEWEPDKNQEIILKANREREAAEANKKVVEVQAEAQAKKILTEATAEAEAIRLRGLGHAEAAEVMATANAEAALKMVVALDGNVSAAGQVLAAQALSKPDSPIHVLSLGKTMPVVYSPEKKEDKK